MPKSLEIGPYRFYFYSYDLGEPAHVHVRREQLEAKFWLDPVELAYNRRFPRHEVNMIEKLIREHHGQLMEKWNAHLANRT